MCLIFLDPSIGWDDKNVVNQRFPILKHQAPTSILQAVFANCSVGARTYGLFQPPVEALF